MDVPIHEPSPLHSFPPGLASHFRCLASASHCAAATAPLGLTAAMKQHQAEVQTTAYDVGSSTNIKWHEGSVGREKRQEMLNQKARDEAEGW